LASSEPAQIDLYREFLDSPVVAELLNSTKSPLAAISVLKKICDSADYPELKVGTLGNGLRGTLSVDTTNANADTSDDSDEDEPFMPAPLPDRTEARSELGLNAQQVVERSCKLSFIRHLLPQLFDSGHRILIFSQSCKMLSLVEKMILRPHQYRYLRLDGKVTKPEERQRRVNEFNKDSRIGCFLLSTRVGGEGITLTGADRVLVIDPAWNPCVDAQAVDRAYRIGQTRDVLIYRLVTCNTVEEKIYKRQLLKGSLGNTLNGKQRGSNDELAHSKRLFSQKISRTFSRSTIH